MSSHIAFCNVARRYVSRYVSLCHVLLRLVLLCCPTLRLFNVAFYFISFGCVTQCCIFQVIALQIEVQIFISTQFSCNFQSLWYCMPWTVYMCRGHCWPLLQRHCAYFCYLIYYFVDSPISSVPTPKQNIDLWYLSHIWTSITVFFEVQPVEFYICCDSSSRSRALISYPASAD